MSEVDRMASIERSAVVCTRCWQVVAIDGENNLDRVGAACSHLGPAVEVAPAEQLRGAVDLIASVAKMDREGGEGYYKKARVMAARARDWLDANGGQ